MKKIHNLFILFIAILTPSCNRTIPLRTGAFDVSVMSFNIRFDTSEDGDNQWNNRKEACLKMINETQPMIMGVQEALVNQVEYFDEQLTEYEYVGVGRDDGETSGEYAAVFYSTGRFELVDEGNFWLSETPETPSLGWDANNIRICTWAHLMDKEHNRPVYVFNTHFDHKGKTAQEESGKLLVQKIEEIAEDGAAVFIIGDFNVLKGNRILDPITESYQDSRQVAEERDNRKSFNAWGTRIRSFNIDYLFFGNVSNALSFKTVIEDYGVPFVSDHYPIIGHFDY